LELSNPETAKEVMNSLSYNPTTVVEKINNFIVVKWIE
jgi:sulfur carrier protein ThiS